MKFHEISNILRSDGRFRSVADAKAIMVAVRDQLLAGKTPAGLLGQHLCLDFERFFIRFEASWTPFA